MSIQENLPRYWATGQSLDWRDYYEIEEGEFNPEETRYIETVLNESARIPEFQETMIGSQSTAVKEAWGEVIRAFSSICNKELPIENFPKVSIIRTGGENFKLVAGQDEKSGVFFSPLARAITLDFDSLGRVGVKNKGGKIYLMTLQHQFVHEAKHSALPNEYRLEAARFQEIKRQMDAGLTPDVALITKAKSQIGTELCEPVVVAATNQIMGRYYNEPHRGGYGDGYIKKKPSDFMAKLDMSDCVFPLPVLNTEEVSRPPLTLEQAVKLLQSTMTSMEGDIPSTPPSSLPPQVTQKKPITR